MAAAGWGAADPAGKQAADPGRLLTGAVALAGNDDAAENGPGGIVNFDDAWACLS